jgi:hypothetical protein
MVMRMKSSLVLSTMKVIQSSQVLKIILAAFGEMQLK